jgi:rhodanese-related sulfurtransferase
MKKVLFLFVAFALVFSLAACGDDDVALPNVGDVDMDNIDDYLFRDDAQYIDLRNFDDKMQTGYISGFEMIPFFDYLESADVVLRNGDWVFSDDEILSQSAIEGLFDMDKAIFLMCGSGTRAGYVKTLLESLGYTNVYNVGGIDAYDGENLVLGDGGYNLEVTPSGAYTPGTYFAMDEASLHMVTIVINMSGGISAVFFDAVNSTVVDGVITYSTTKQALGDAYNMVTYGGANQEWYMQANELGDAIVANQGWNTAWAIVDGDFDVTDQDVIDDVAGVTVGVDAFMAAYEAAILLATPAS